MNYSNDTMGVLTHVYLSVLQPNTPFIYRSGACFDAILFTISTSYVQPIKLVEPVRLHTGPVYMEEKAVYMNNL